MSAIDDTLSLLDYANDMHTEKDFLNSALHLGRTVQNCGHCMCSQSDLCTTNCIFAFPKGIHTQNLFHNHSSVP